MRLYLYGLILRRNAHLLPGAIEGIAGGRVGAVTIDDLAALVSEVENAAPNLETVRAHDRVMRTVVEHGITALPVRFGQTFAEERELRRHVGERGTALSAALGRMDGFVEMRLLMALPEPSVLQGDATTPGRAYLEQLRGSQRLVGLALRPALGPVVLEERVSQLPREAGVAFAHLVQRSDEASYREAVASQPSLHEAKVVGPLALYSFGDDAS